MCKMIENMISPISFTCSICKENIELQSTLIYGLSSHYLLLYHLLSFAQTGLKLSKAFKNFPSWTFKLHSHNIFRCHKLNCTLLSTNDLVATLLIVTRIFWAHFLWRTLSTRKYSKVDDMMNHKFENYRHLWNLTI